MIKDLRKNGLEKKFSDVDMCRQIHKKCYIFEILIEFHKGGKDKERCYLCRYNIKMEFYVHYFELTRFDL